MPQRFAVANGNWSSGATWDNGAAPLAADTAYSNGFTVTIDTTASIVQLANFATTVYLPNNAIPAMTSNTAPSGIVNASGTNIAYQSWWAFSQDGPGGNTWRSNVTNSGWLSYQFPSVRTIRRYAIGTGNSTPNTPRTWTFEGSNDGSAWTVLDTQTNLSLTQSGWFTYAIASPASYLYYRINITAVNTAGNAPELSELNMTESTATVFGATTGGTFSFANGGNMTCTASTGLSVALTTPVVSFSLSSPNSATLNANILSITNGASYIPISHSGTGTLNVNGNLSHSSNTSGIFAINFTGSGTLNIVGNLTLNSSTTNIEGIIRTTGGGNINITGDVINAAGAGSVNSAVISNGNAGGSANVTVTGNISSVNTGAPGTIWIASGNTVINGNVNAGGSTCINTSAGNITINGNVTAGAAGGAGIATSTIGNITVSGTVTASTTQVAINSSSTGLVICNGNLVNNSNGIMAVFASRINISASSTQTWNMFRAGGVARNLLTPDQIVVSGSFPATSNVRNGTSYGLGLYTGTLVIPPQASVAFGVPVDGVVGSAVLPVTIGDLIWAKLTSDTYVVGSVGERMKNIATTDIAGNQIAALKR